MAVSLGLSLMSILERAAFGQDGHGPVQVVQLIKLGTTPSLRNMRPLPPQAGPKRELPLRPIPDTEGPTQTDTVVQTTVGPLISGTQTGFEGVGDGSYGFTPDAAPPDTTGAVGATQYVQWVNESFAVFDKATGALLYGPVPGNTLWKDTGSWCELTNDGDPIVRYDGTANQWVFTQLSYTFGLYGYGYYSCIAISATSDATGSYYLYWLGFPNLNDYHKLAVWSDAYYMTFNMFQPLLFSWSFVGPQVCALERAKMLTGDPAARALCFQLGAKYSSLLAADVEGSTQGPPAGAPNYILGLGKNALQLWKFHADWVNTSNTTLTGPTNIGVASFNKACGGGTCIPQPDTTQQLDSLGDRLMYRLGYRNFGDHESLVANHSVAVGGRRGNNGIAGIRWYEIRNPSGTPQVYQQGTFRPDSTHRWMGSIAMDKVGNILVGYSASSSSVFPSIRFTGRLSTDTLNTLQTEATIVDGGGSQLPSLSRWGDYSTMSVDPDGCTFWYTNQYQQTSGTFNWSTRIASFKFPDCR